MMKGLEFIDYCDLAGGSVGVWPTKGRPSFPPESLSRSERSSRRARSLSSSILIPNRSPLTMSLFQSNSLVDIIARSLSMAERISRRESQNWPKREPIRFRDTFEPFVYPFSCPFRSHVVLARDLPHPPRQAPNRVERCCYHGQSRRPFLNCYALENTGRRPTQLVPRSSKHFAAKRYRRNNLAP